MSRKTKKEGQFVQLPLDFLLPESDWVPPTELPDWRGRKLIAVDLETKDNGLAAGRGPSWPMKMGHVSGVAMATGDEQIYVPIRHPETENFDPDQVGRWLADHMAAVPETVFHHAHYDLGWMWAEWGIEPTNRVHDTQGMAVGLDENRLQYNLHALCTDAKIPGKDRGLLEQAARAFGVDPKASIWKLPGRYVGPYASQDAGSTLGLYHYQKTQLEAQEGTWGAYLLESDLIPMVVEMRKRGINVDLDRADALRRQMRAELSDLLADVSYRLAIGRQVTVKDLGSPVFLEKIFDSEGVPYPRTKGGRGSFNKDWMPEYPHWLPQAVHRISKLDDFAEKFIGTYIMDFAHMGKIHADIKQYKGDDGGTVTSRFAYSDPPLQQIPARDELLAPLVRGIFKPNEGETWGALDYSQQEFRLIVHFAYVCKQLRAEEAVALYRSNPNQDFHDLVASMTGLPRKPAKDANFAKAYGAGVPKFANMSNRTLEEAEAIMKQYDEQMPYVAGLSNFCDQRAQAKGYVRLVDGARAHFDRWAPRWQSGEYIAPVSRELAFRWCKDPDHPWYRERIMRADTRKAMNRLVQGSAARQCKTAMRDSWREGFVPLVQMHDELSYSFSSQAEADRAREIMVAATPVSVPMKVDAEFGRSWGEASQKGAATSIAEVYQ